MNDRELSDALKRLPRVTASPRFTSDVLRRLSPEPARGHARVAWRFATAAVLVLTLAGVAFATHAVHQRAARLDQLRVEQERIEDELQRVKAIAAAPRPVVVLENDDTRVVVPVSMRRSAAASQTIIY